MECLEPVRSVQDGPAPVLTSGRGARHPPTPPPHPPCCCFLVCYYVTGFVFPERLSFLRGERDCFHPHSLAPNTPPSQHTRGIAH